MALLKVSGLNKVEKGKSIVKDIYFTQLGFQKIAIAGETGSGKTTLLKMIAGLIQPDTGEIQFENKRVVGPYEKLIPGHPGIAYLSQHFELRNNYKVEEELEAVNKLTNKEADHLYQICRIEHLLKRRTDQLSGGERQRIVLARLLTTAPKLLLLDEPFSNLDAVHRNIIKSVINDIGDKLKITCIMVSHDALDLLSWADIILVMRDGQLIQQGSPEHIYRQPVNEYCAGLFGEYNLINNSMAFFAIPGIQLNGKKLLIRPEHFSITTTGNNGLNGIIKNILFRGSYYSIDVWVDEQLIRVQTSNDQLAVGGSICFTVSPDKVWHL
ncbi:MAG TPA: ABC transporter ATP-binding protein [Chitinophagaceae bacterium]|nr:ABC transporter ATP-binding protein [Chitinophagaceae bacterium]